MKTLAIDTSWKNLVIALIEDGKLKEGISREAFKQQSEMLSQDLHTLLEKAGWKLKDIEEVLITQGPGSYTGLRIAMTFAKVLATQAGIPCKVISTMQLYAGTSPSANVILDARGKRVYAGHVENGIPVFTGILPVEKVQEFLQENPGDLYGEGELANQDALPSDFLQNFADLLPYAKTVENVHALTPLYLKESSDYKA
jgi:tRNA threonylcarbamoyl adenosine modification protein YeaZ